MTSTTILGRLASDPAALASVQAALDRAAIEQLPLIWARGDVERVFQAFGSLLLEATAAILNRLDACDQAELIQTAAVIVESSLKASPVPLDPSEIMSFRRISSAVAAWFSPSLTAPSLDPSQARAVASVARRIGSAFLLHKAARPSCAPIIEAEPTRLSPDTLLNRFRDAHACLKAAGEPDKGIAAQLGIHRGTVARILRGAPMRESTALKIRRFVERHKC